jgi:hypothetical protein
MANGTTDFVHDRRVACMKTYGLTHQQGDGLGREARMGGEEPARHLQGANHRRRCVEFADDRLPVPIVQCCLVTDGGGALIPVLVERARDLPQQPVYLLGTGESVETPMPDGGFHLLARLPRRRPQGVCRGKWRRPSSMHSGMYALQESVRQMRGITPPRSPAPRSRSAMRRRHVCRFWYDHHVQRAGLSSSAPSSWVYAVEG